MLKHPENLDKARVAELKALLVEFPYFQAGKMLLLKNLHNLKHYEYDKNLRNISISVPDRVRLYQYIENEIPTSILPSSANQPNDKPTEQIIEQKEDSITPPPQIDIPVIEKNIETSTDTEIEQISVDDNHEEIAPEPLIQETITEPQSEAVQETVHISVNETHSFAEWLKMSKSGVHPVIDEKTPESEEPVLPATANEETTEVVLNKPNSIVEKNDAGKSNVKDFESILDKFIRENPRISRPKAEFYNPANMAKQSVEENEDIATETLAKLYLSQGHIKKAIRTYEKLCLIYPHRITYFADLIQKIKTEHKD